MNKPQTRKQATLNKCLVDLILCGIITKNDFCYDDYLWEYVFHSEHPLLCKYNRMHISNAEYNTLFPNDHPPIDPDKILKLRSDYTSKDVEDILVTNLLNIEQLTGVNISDILKSLFGTEISDESLNNWSIKFSKVREMRTAYRKHIETNFIVVDD